MIKYRISKYNPIFRNSNDEYIKSEWTSCYDIGKIYNGSMLKVEEYISIEERYISTIIEIIEKKKVVGLLVKDMEKNFLLKDIENNISTYNLFMEKREKEVYKNISENVFIHKKDIKTVIKMILRECFWCELINDSGDFILEFGYDLYVYIICGEISQEIIENALKNNIYIEEIKGVTGK